MKSISEKIAALSEDRLKPLDQAFYLPTASEVAPKLLGHLLLRRTEKGLVGGPIVESEAYIQDDPACHAFKGPSKRNQSMFGPPGRAYVYLIYGFYHCFNAVCAPEGSGEAVLVRAVEPLFGIDFMEEKRPVDDERKLTSGPGKLCVAMDIGRGLDGADLCDRSSEVVICRNPFVDLWLQEHGALVTTTRIGLTKASDWPLRFYPKDHPNVSKRDKPPSGRQKRNLKL